MPKKFPKISIITPSYNQAQFIEQTIKSVLSQNYPNLEYIVMDGGSTDGTLDILKKYNRQLIWVSEKDKGQSHAINKGLKKVTGEIIGYLNSDDHLEKESLFKVGEFFSKYKDAYWLTGKCHIIDEKNREVRRLVTFYKNIFLKYLKFKMFFYIVQFISQPSTFWRSSIIKESGYFDESLNYDMDYDFWLRIWQKYQLFYIDDYLSSYRVHKASKAVISPETQFKVEYEIIRRYTNSKVILLIHRLHMLFALEIYNRFFIK